MSFSFIPTPTGPVMSDGDLLTSALDQPMSLGSTLWDQSKGGALSSFGLGTAVRDLGTPEAAPPVSDNPVANVLGTINRAIAPENIIRSIAGTSYDGSNPLTEDQYKASPSFRKDIPFQQGMTQERADALAQMDDVKQVRAFYADKRPITAFIGNLAGSAIDPINYIPIAGEAVAAANTARFGKILGRTVTSALDASGNAALAAVSTIPEREQLGDDTSWQSTVSQIAMAAIIGGGFGALHGRFGRDAAPDLHAEANDKLSTLQNVQESRVALNDALDGMINRGEVEMSPASTEFVASMSDRLPRLPTADDAAARMDAQDAADNLAISEEHFAAAQKGELPEGASKATLPVLSDKATWLELDRRNNEITDAVHEALDSGKTEPVNIDGLETRQHWLNPEGTSSSDRAPVVVKIGDKTIIRDGNHRIEAARKAGDQSIDATVVHLGPETPQASSEPRLGQPLPVDQTATEADPNGPTTAPQRAPPPVQSAVPRASIDTSSPVEAQNPDVAKAKTRVGKPEGSKALAEQYRVDPKTGDFPELDEIKQLDSEGRMTDEDRASMDDADETLKTANAYGEALKAFANCVI